MASGHEGEVVIDPMHQFEIKPLFGGDLGMFSITNSTLWMALAVICISALLILSSRGRHLVPTRMLSISEVLYGFIRQMCVDVLGQEGLKFFPYIFTIFMFILFSNLLGLIPYSFTTTSHVAVTGVMALAVFLIVIIIGFARHGLKFLGLFWVTSAPMALRPALALIEIISFFVRPLSHSVRLAGNMMAGHAVLKVFAGLAAMIVAGGLGPLAILPIGAMVGISALELLVAVVQAYIFAILTAIYLNDALHLH
ncbi:F0F1 ATP synthase subunit A [Pikeienuella piscinae]|uniref:ATP synthase subunit a n=1 Tax=Pikeienuella piscinae TaxID=2748098 RepID=A0A7L5C015_9RHOB|nr:F0F1 ATP synthase subunit A [Pikeienuella piscinae]QIE57071.1 F0F1 ATP synthase subunit A [Pikeienuella piscinae]